MKSFPEGEGALAINRTDLVENMVPRNSEVFGVSRGRASEGGGLGLARGREGLEIPEDERTSDRRSNDETAIRRKSSTTGRAACCIGSILESKDGVHVSEIKNFEGVVERTSHDSVSIRTQRNRGHRLRMDVETLDVLPDPEVPDTKSVILVCSDCN